MALLREGRYRTVARTQLARRRRSTPLRALRVGELREGSCGFHGSDWKTLRRFELAGNRDIDKTKLTEKTLQRESLLSWAHRNFTAFRAKAPQYFIVRVVVGLMAC